MTGQTDENLRLYHGGPEPPTEVGDQRGGYDDGGYDYGGFDDGGDDDGDDRDDYDVG